MTKKLKSYDEEERLEDAAEWINKYEGNNIKKLIVKGVGLIFFLLLNN